MTQDNGKFFDAEAELRAEFERDRRDDYDDYDGTRGDSSAEDEDDGQPSDVEEQEYFAQDTDFFNSEP
jgi:hypothetical protein